MIVIKFDGKEYEIKNEAKELLVGEFEVLSAILNDEGKDEVASYIKVFTELGIPEEVIDSMDYDDFEKVITQLNLSDVLEKEYKQEIVIDGYTYVSYTGDDFKLKVKDMSLIEIFVKNNPNKYIGELLAVLFKRTDLSKVEHYDKEHLKHKAKLFRENVTADIAIPFIVYFSDKLIKNVKEIAKGGE